MKKNSFLFIFLSTLSFFLNKELLSGNTTSRDHNKQVCNFITKRLDKNFTLANLKELCHNHSEKAANLFSMALENLTEIEGKIPKEVLEKVQFFRDHSFMYFIKHTDSLLNECAYKIATKNWDGLAANEKQLIQILRSVAFHIKVNGCYDAKLAKFLIKIHLDRDYQLSQVKLDKYLCTASSLGNIGAVELLLYTKMNPNFVNKCDNSYTPLAYALIQEHHYSKIKNKSLDQALLCKLYEITAKLLIKNGARVDLPITNRISGKSLNKTYIFMQTNNIQIFKSFEDQIANKIELTDGLGCNVVMNAFKLGNAQFIKYLYANPLYKNSQKARTPSNFGGTTSHQSFMALASKYYKHYDFKELFAFLTENNEIDESEKDINKFQFQCLWNAIIALDYECIKSLSKSGVPLHYLYNDRSTNLIQIIKKASELDDKENLIKIIELFERFGIKFFEHRDATGSNARDYALKDENLTQEELLEKLENELRLLTLSDPIKAYNNYKGINRKLDNRILDALVMTPLLYMLKTNNAGQNDVLELICKIKNEYDIEIFSYKDSYGKTAIDYAQQFNQDCSVIETLKAYTTYNFE